MLCAAWMRGEFREEWIHAYIWLGHFALHLKLLQLVTLQYKIKIKVSTARYIMEYLGLS